MKKTERRNSFPRVMVVLVLSLILLTVTPVTTLASGIPVGSTAYVNVDDYLNMRAEPQGEIIGQIARGEKVTILSGPDRNHYYKVQVNKTGEVCYLYGEYLVGSSSNENTTSYSPSTSTTSNSSQISQNYTHTGIYATVNSDKKLNLREGPSRNKNRVRYLEDGELVEILEQTTQNNYIKVVAVNDGKVGYVDISYLDLPSAETDEVTCNCQCECCCK